jgi:malonate-semialdehyde dehydrogenase (acetylating)/methylmalonate-semialdehyde dehydrogenase
MRRGHCGRAGLRTLNHFIGGQAVAGTSGRFSDVFDPNTGKVQARVALADVSELDAAVANARAAQKPAGRRPTRSAARG